MIEGEHETTKLCIQWILRHASGIDQVTEGLNTNATRILDIGTGSGILSIAAALVYKHTMPSVVTQVGNSQMENIDSIDNIVSMPSFMIVGTDTDEIAVKAAQANINTNQVDSVVFAYHCAENGNVIETSAVNQVRGHQPQAVEINSILKKQNFDIVIANILAPTLSSLLPFISQNVRTGGRICLSGLLNYQAEDILKEYQRYFDKCRIIRDTCEWIVITGIRNEAPYE